MIKISILFFSAFLLLSCAAKNPSAQLQAYEKVAYDAFNVSKDIIFTLNDKEDYALATYKEDNPSVIGGGIVRAIVIKIEDAVIVYKKNIPGGSMEWISAYEIKLVSPPGMTQGDESIDDYTSIFNVQTGETYLLNAREK